MRRNKILLLILTIALLFPGISNAQEKYFTAPTADAMQLDDQGFLRRWTVLEPISKPNHTNIVFTDSYLRDVFSQEYFKNQMTIVPKDGQKVKAKFEKMDMPRDFRRIDPSTLKVTRGTETLRWHKLDSKTFNLKLLRFGEYQTKRLYGVIYWVVTVINCEEEMSDVRLSVGSNSASMWWVNGDEALILSGDRRMVADDGMSRRLMLKKGENIIRGAIINGPGMSDFCVRFVKADGTVIKEGITIK